MSEISSDTEEIGESILLELLLLLNLIALGISSRSVEVLFGGVFSTLWCVIWVMLDLLVRFFSKFMEAESLGVSRLIRESKFFDLALGRGLTLGRGSWGFRSRGGTDDLEGALDAHFSMFIWKLHSKCDLTVTGRYSSKSKE